MEDTEKKWYELEPTERFEQVYKKYSIKDFFNWLVDDKKETIEIRFDKWQIADECSKKFFVKKNMSSVFIDKPNKLVKIIKEYRFKSTMWFGVNPKRATLNKYGKKHFSGKDVNIDKIKFLFIDIDRRNKNGPATSKDLMDCDFLTDMLIKELNSVGFCKNYCKICSGNGIQLLVKLDVPIMLPEPSFDSENRIYIESKLFQEIKNTIKDGIGKTLPKFSSKFEHLNAEIDDKCFNIGRVGALPYSMNLKYEIPIPRGIVELKNKEQNTGLSDYIVSIYENKEKKEEIKKTYEKKKTDIFIKEYEIIQNNISKNNIINLMLNYEFPSGGINNTLWYAVKILLHKNSITNRNPDYVKIINILKQIHNRSFSDNGLEERYKDNYEGYIKEDAISMVPFMVNKYLRNNKIKKIGEDELFYHPPIFPLSPRGKIKHDITIDINESVLNYNITQPYKLKKQKEDPLNDLKDFCDVVYKIRKEDNDYKEHLIKPYEYTTVGKFLIQKKITDLFISFLNSFKDKWGEELTLYMLNNYMKDYINYKRL